MKCHFALIASLSLSSLSANDLITPTSLETKGISEFFAAINLINDSGLSAPPDIATYETVTHTSASGTSAWVTDAQNGNGAGDYFLEGSEGQVPEFTFALPEASTVNALVYWGYFFTSFNGNEVRKFVVEFSSDGGTTFPETVTVASDLGDLTGASARTLPFGRDFIADTIRIRFTDNHFGGGAPEAGGDRMGLGELKFIGTPGTGEPPAIIDFDYDGSEFSITSTTGLRAGTTYHLESGSTLQDFTPVTGSEFTSDSPAVPTVTTTGNISFVRIVAGPIPAP